MQLTGYGDRTLPSASSPIISEGGKISCRRDENLTEWFINDTRGLEQGWTLQHSPERPDGSAPLTLHLAPRGNLRPQVSADGSGVSFQNHESANVITYNGLKAWDAGHHSLPVNFEQDGKNGIRISVDDRNALYPITIDPIAQQASIIGANTGNSDQFGVSVAISGDTVVVGANLEDGSGTGINPGTNESAADAGAAYVFVRSAGVWTQQAYLKASNTGVGDSFGISVAISGDTLIVGATGEDGGGNQVDPPSDETEAGAGAAYVFVRSTGVWSQQAYLKGSASGASDNFGVSVGVSDDTIVVGAELEDGSGSGVNPSFNNALTDAGAAYVFSRSGTVWTSSAYLKASNPDASDQFGKAVAISGDSVVVGARYEAGNGSGVNPPADNLAPGAGAAYVFKKSGLVWAQQAYLKASNVQFSDHFGGAVSISDDTLVVGATGEDGAGTGANPASNEGAFDSGAAYVFTRNGTVWTQQAYLKPSNPAIYFAFGYSVAVSGEAMVVGGTGNTGLGQTEGLAYAFARSGSVWSQQAQLAPTPLAPGYYFGYSVAISGDTGIVGAPQQDSFAGSAYLFTGIGTSFPEIVVKRPGTTLLDNSGTQSFDPVNVGGSANMVFNIRNSGLVALNLTGSPNKVTVSGPDAAMFSITTQPVSPVAASNGSTFFNARFSPTSAGTKTAVLSIASDDSDENPFEINLSGVVAFQEIAISQNAVDIASGGSKDFGNVSVGSGANLVFQISNTGGADLTLTNLPKIVVSGPDAAMFSVISQPSSSVIPSGTTSFTARFLPTSGGTKSATLTLPNNDGDEGTFQINLTGTAPPAEIAIEETAVDIPDGGLQNFGGVVVASSTDLTFAIKNTGGVSLVLSGAPKVNVSGTDAALFSIVAQPASPVTPGGSVPFTVRFTPSSGGAKTAHLTITNSDADENPFDIDLAGTGLTFTMDTDGDGLNDASESQLAPLGFNWQVAQPALVSGYYANANGANLYSPSQVQALNVDVPLIQRNLAGTFTLTLGIEKSTNLVNFTPFPMTAPQTLINGQGKLEFQFNGSGNAAFFRVEAK